jgi:hypothetical protein
MAFSPLSWRKSSHGFPQILADRNYRIIRVDLRKSAARFQRTSKLIAEPTTIFVPGAGL